MAINDSNKVDFLWKKVLFGVSNTSVNGKQGYEEIYSSEVPTYANKIWTQAGNIASPAPEATTGVHEFYDAANAIECTPDPTVPNNRTWLVTTTRGDINTLTGDWIPPTFDPSYLIQVYKGDPNNGGTPLIQGSDNEEWVFDYVTGTLSFVNNVPAGVNDTGSGNRIFIVGHRYVGSKGLTGAGGAAASEEVATIAERDALTPSIGTIAYVADASGDTANAAHIGAGEAATYLYTSSGWVLIATEDSGKADAGSVSLDITNASSNSTIFTVDQGTRITGITLEVNTAFDGDPVVQIGDAGLADRLLEDNLVDLAEVGVYTLDVNYLYNADTDVLLDFVAGGATTGQANIVIKWSS